MNQGAKPATEKQRDAYMLLAGAKSHLADHQPMTADDEEAWSILDYLQGVARGN